jgi:palmitoyltransferase
MKRWYPKAHSDRISFFFAMIMIHVVGFFELFVILPYIDADGTRTYWLHVVTGLTIYINVMASFYKLFTVDSSTSGVVLPSLKPPGWSYCSECAATSPPRCRHCWICNVCVLRRDHHCIFTGNCVGYRNQRYFLSLLLYLTIGAIYCNYLNMDYTLEALGGELTPRAILTMILPMLAWTVGLSGGYTFAVSFVSAMCIVGLALFAFLSVYHGRNILRGQTCQEAGAGQRDYDYGPLENMRQIFGHRWVLAWLCPLMSSPLPGNGTEYKSRFLHETVKDM